MANWPNGTIPRVKCTYDGWNRLVKVEQLKPGGWDWVSYAYNGLNWKVREQRHVVAYGLAPPPLPPPAPVGDSLRWTFYSLSWQQLLEVAATTANPPVVTGHEQQVWGLRGTDDAILRRYDLNGDGLYTQVGEDVPERAFYRVARGHLRAIAVWFNRPRAPPASQARAGLPRR